LIKLEGIETSWDFLDWKEDVFNCPFLSPISKKEFELYYQYAMSDNFVIEEDLFISLQGNTMEDESEIQLSEWFEYHNTYTGAEKYLNLPNTRVEKENYYRSLNFKNQQKEKEKLNNDKKPVKKEIDMRPDIKSYVFKDVENFVKLFEDDKTKRLFYNYEDFMPDLDRYPETDDKYLDEKAEEIYDNLSKLTHTLPIEANDDWRLALINVWDNYEIANVRKILPLVFEDYLFRVENNIQIETINRDYLPRLGEMVIEQIFNGRELCGEPRNLDF
jgi:hypothetical protein